MGKPLDRHRLAEQDLGLNRAEADQVRLFQRGIEVETRHLQARVNRALQDSEERAINKLYEFGVDLLIIEGQERNYRDLIPELQDSPVPAVK